MADWNEDSWEDESWEDESWDEEQPSNQPYSVAELTFSIRDMLEQNFGTVEVVGEISNFRRPASGHCYFTLKDAEAQIRAVMFRGDAGKLNFNPADGQEVRVTASLTVYAPRGDYQLRITSMSPRGKGTLQEQFEALKSKLQKEGLFDSTHKQDLPLFPRRVGVVTSSTGAALRDFLNVLDRRCPRMEVHVFGVRVQGDEAAPEIARAVEYFNSISDTEEAVDVIVLTRGGGSLEDLWAFNEEVVAKAVYASEVPTISGVGHEVDFTIADFVADMRAPTPSAAAEMLSQTDEEWAERLEGLRYLLNDRTQRQLQERRWKLEQLAGSYVFKEPVRIVEQWQQRLDELRLSLQRGLERNASRQKERLEALLLRWSAVHPSGRIEQLRQKLAARQDALRLLSPQQTLDRGYSIAFDKEGKVVRTVKGAKASGDLKVQLSDGSVDTQVQ